MTNDEKRKLAVARELDELRKCVRSFDEVVESARRLAVDCRESLERFRKIESEAQFYLDDSLNYCNKCDSFLMPDEHTLGHCGDCDRTIDEKIDHLDRLTNRGKYATHLIQSARNVQGIGDTIAEICINHAESLRG